MRPTRLALVALELALAGAGCAGARAAAGRVPEGEGLGGPEWACAGVVPPLAARRRMLATEDRVHGCLEGEWGHTAEAAFRLTLRVAENGVPDRARIVPGAPLDDDARDCVYRAVLGLRFPRPLGGDCAVVSVPYRFAEGHDEGDADPWRVLAALRVRATVRRVQGRSPVRVGAPCDFEVLRVRRADGGSWCRALVACGERLLYGGPDAGYFDCELGGVARPFVRGADPWTTSEDGDAAMGLDTPEGTLQVRDDASGAFGRFSLRAHVDRVRALTEELGGPAGAPRPATGGAEPDPEEADLPAPPGAGGEEP